MSVSIVIPVKHDAGPLATLLAALGETTSSGAGVEVIVVGADEQDVQLDRLAVEWPGVRWLRAPTGRGPQMNAGAAMASGRWLWFLHADSLPPLDWREAFAELEADADIVGGSFAFALDSPAWQARWLERGVAWRVRLFGLPYGDQGLFVRREVFEQMGGFAPLPLMEDVEFVRRLARCGRLRHLTRAVTTSARRFEAAGWLRRSAGNLLTLGLYDMGASPEWLARRYDQGRPRTH